MNLLFSLYWSNINPTVHKIENHFILIFSKITLIPKKYWYLQHKIDVIKVGNFYLKLFFQSGEYLTK
jgi:hypothetical protein